MEVRVPDIGDFKDVPIIAVLVKAGDRIEQEQPIVTLESDKATVDVPAPAAGTVADVRVKVGDKVSEGSVLLILETAGKAAEPQKPKPAAPEQGPKAAPPEEPARRATREESHAAAARTEGGPFDCDVLVLGSGPGGYAAAFRAADLGKRVVLIERYKALGGVCLNVGCIPSKALLHVASLMDGARDLAGHGVSFGDARIEVEKLRAWKDKVVGRLSGGVAMMAKARKVEVVTGEGKFTGPHELAVGERRIRFDKAIIAAGSQAAKLPFLPDDPRIVDSTGALELPAVPQRMLVIGGGIIGMEMATVYSTLGSRIDVVEMLEGLMTGADRDLVQVWQKKNAPRFDRLMLKTKTVGAEAARDGIHVRFDGGAEPAIYDMVLVSVGRTPNGKRIGAEAAGVQVDDRGYIPTDKQMRTNVPHIFAIGDIAGPPMLAHKATHEGHVAAEVAAGHKASFDARQVPSVAYTDPEIAWAGATEDELKKSGTEYGKSVFPWSASGRAIANARDEGFVKLLFDKANGRVIGGGIVGLNAGDLISEICLAIEMGADAEDIGRTIHPHPTLGESIGLAAEVFTGTCTDLPPPRRR
ncbi:MAG: dihydrolipoyl dehydrogenase [Deltaproteobacteria bacterium]|nr:MAG: dihydrolipoyl dehydrogenase [Deltaproteobacteria bacterium]TMB41160.1 MAG: dihydrolipoyl dehydrogenase [Deltaproteobacteria bacterium]